MQSLGSCVPCREGRGRTTDPVSDLAPHINHQWRKWITLEFSPPGDHKKDLRPRPGKPCDNYEKQLRKQDAARPDQGKKDKSPGLEVVRPPTNPPKPTSPPANRPDDLKQVQEDIKGHFEKLAFLLQKTKETQPMKDIHIESILAHINPKCRDLARDMLKRQQTQFSKRHGFAPPDEDKPSQAPKPEPHSMDELRASMK
ncbi:hypothetical protein LZ32DRAFT_306671 [Colletotrichum eremochloae]|nr:hypothetical protein LZ32DRAFT_306671 [Colletotrichum eremochloae]